MEVGPGNAVSLAVGAVPHKEKVVDRATVRPALKHVYVVSFFILFKAQAIAD